ncbi:hypothetical protein Scep_013205 [Stephania cephalantha]|uniref:Uncharacterized protein n=1 Tax=Stephania cephalantha TaxID=152367 RepID=A0AAP0JGZ8_9MAGN
MVTNDSYRYALVRKQSDLQGEERNLLLRVINRDQLRHERVKLIHIFCIVISR